MKNAKLVNIFLRLSVASVFIYAAVAATIEPFNWIGYIPQFFRNIFPGSILLLGFSAFQLVLGVWIISGWKTFYAGILAALTTLAVIAANFTQTDILFRDFAIFFSALALTSGSYKTK